MKRFLLKWFVNTIAVAFVVKILPGVYADSFGALLMTSLFLGVFGPLLRIVLIFFTLPLFILSLGLIYFIINGFILYIASVLIPGFTISSFWGAVLASLIISLMITLINWFIKDDNNPKIIVYR